NAVHGREVAEALGQIPDLDDRLCHSARLGLEEVLFEFFVDMAGEALPAQDLAVVLGLAVMAPETIHRSMGLDHRGLDGCLLCLRNLVQPDVPARDHDFVTLVRLRVDHGGVTSRAALAPAP